MHKYVKLFLRSAILTRCFKIESWSGDGSDACKLAYYCFKSGFKDNILQWFRIYYCCSDVAIHSKVHESAVTSQLGGTKSTCGSDRIKPEQELEVVKKGS